MYISKTLILGLALMVAMILSLATCNRCNPPQYAGKIDTTYVAVHDTVESSPAITFIEGGHIPEKVDTVYVIKTFYERVGYADTVHTKFGLIRIYDTVTQNRLLPRTVFTDFNIPVITKQAPPRNQVYFGVGGQWNIVGQQLAVGPSLMFKTKRDVAFELGAYINTANQWTYQASMKFKISLHH